MYSQDCYIMNKNKYFDAEADLRRSVLFQEIN
jgi:hypothetical protein